MADTPIFRFPVRSADVFGFNEPGDRRAQEDIASDLDLQDNAVEDFLSNVVADSYVALDSGTGLITTAQLASGSPSAGTAPVSNGSTATWTDVATQAELDAVAATIPAAGAVLGTDIKRGTSAVTLNGTTTTRAVTFSGAFAATPVVVATALVESDLASISTNLTACTTGGFVFRATSLTSTTTTATVFWTAIKA